MNRPDLAMVYAVRRLSDGAIKIGRTRDINVRVIALRADHGLCELTYLMPVLASDAAAVESAAHESASAFWVDGEWFKFTGPKQSGEIHIRRAWRAVMRGTDNSPDNYKRRKAERFRARWNATRFLGSAAP